MNERSLRVLEYPKIIQHLKGLTSFPPGAERAQSLEPTTRKDGICYALTETAEAARLLRDHGSHPLSGARDVRDSVGRAARGGTLTGPELLDVVQTTAVIGRCRNLLAGDKTTADGNPWPGLSTLVEHLGTFQPLERAVRAAIGEDGLVLDRASNKLARLRARIRTWHAKSRERIDAVMRSAGTRQALQEAIVTVRNDRYVVPVKVEYKTVVPGIVHDASSSGATVFIEPLAVVELNNKVKEAQAEEEREVERILRELSTLVASEASALFAGVDALGRLDLALAKALLADRMHAVQPSVNDERRVKLLKARHPLLTGDVVPVDVWLGEEARILVITGPNTGGKTVTLKTVGLFCLMAQSGLFVPAAAAELPVFDGVYADIGDEQSIEQSLSTFSGHMANIVAILAAVDDQSLVLLDELGAGTDPAEGAALAMAVLQHLADDDVTTVATTHYSELKLFVHEHRAMQNASVEFDVETLAPTYRLIMGTPGRSNALEIAARLGLPTPILDAARGQFAKADDARVEDLLRDLELARSEALRERAVALQLRKEAETLRAGLEEVRASLDAKRHDWERRASAEAKRVLTDARQEVASIIAELRLRADTVGVEQARAAYRRIEGRLHGLDVAPSRTAVETSDGTADAAFVPGPGDAVRLRTLRQTGTVQSGPDADGQWTVLVGSMRIVVPTKDLEPANVSCGGATSGGRASAGGGSAGKSSGLLPAKRASISPEVSLRGMLVDDALYTLEKYLDDALLAGLDRVLVVHGKGTGTLRRAVHDYVRGHPYVKNWYIADQSAGGYGATVVEL